MAEVFGQLPPESIVNIELNCEPASQSDLADAAVNAVRRFEAQARVLFSSFRPGALQRLRQLDLRVLAWGDQELTEPESLLMQDVDGVITDRPAEALRIISARA